MTYLNGSLISLPDPLLLFFPGFVQFPDRNPSSDWLRTVSGYKDQFEAVPQSTAERSSLWKFFSRISSNETPSFDGLVKYFKFIKRSILRPAYFSSLCHIRKKEWHKKEAFRLKWWDYRDISLYFNKKGKSSLNEWKQSDERKAAQDYKGNVEDSPCFIIYISP